MTESDVPALSVVIPAVNGWPDLNRCLAAIEAERADVDLQVLVPERCGESVRREAGQRYPWAQLIPVPLDTSIPQMRAIAFRKASAPTVVVIEDHIIVPRGWANAMLNAVSPEARVVGGGLVNAATDGVVDWAAWLCEYNHLAGPMPAGRVEGIHGNHTAYDRALLNEHMNVAESGQWEDALHAAMKQSGVVLWSRPDIVAGHEKHYSVGEYLAQRFYYSRAYAAMQTKNAGAARRLASGLFAFALPPVLFLRIVSRVWKGGLYREHLLGSLPLLALFVSSWGLGEVAGAWFGDGGALAKVA